jgi:hypothetical protein
MYDEPGIGRPSGDLAVEMMNARAVLARAGVAAIELESVLSGIGDVLHCFARALQPQDRAELVDHLIHLIATVGVDDPRAIVPKALLSVLKPPAPTPARLRVIAGGRGKRVRRLDPDVAAGRSPRRG